MFSNMIMTTYPWSAIFGCPSLQDPDPMRSKMHLRIMQNLRQDVSLLPSSSLTVE